MKKKLFAITIILLLNFMYFNASGQYKPIEKISKEFAEANKKILKSFFKTNEKKNNKKNSKEIKILVLPFLNKNQKLDKHGNNIAKQIASQLQLKLQRKKKKIAFLVKNEFNEKHIKMLRGYGKEPNSDKECEKLLEKFKPDYCISGNYAITKNDEGEDIIKLFSVNIQNYYYNLENTGKTGLVDCKIIIDIKTEDFIWVSEKEDKKSLDLLIENISVHLKTKFLDVETQNFNMIMKSYKGLLSRKIQSRKKGNYEIIKYISKDTLEQIFSERKSSITEYLKKGLKAEKERKIEHALMNYYRALLLMRTYPKYETLRFDFGDGQKKMSLEIPEKIRAILRNTEFTIEKIEQSQENNTVRKLNIRIKYKNKSVQNIVYKYRKEKEYSGYIYAKNGTSKVKLYGNYSKLAYKIEYIFADRQQEDQAFEEALKIKPQQKFREAEKIIAVPRFQILKIYSQPSGANFYLDGYRKLKGTTPYEKNIPEGIYEYSIKKDKYHDANGKIRVEVGKTHEINEILKPKFGKIIIKSKPSGADIFINNDSTGKNTPAIFDFQKPKIYKITVKKNGYETKTETITLTEGNKIEIEIELEKKYPKDWWDNLEEEWQEIFREEKKFTGIPDRKKITEIFIIDSLNISGNKNIKNLEPLKNLTELRKLYCYKTEITSLEPLKNLNNLKILYCDDTKIDSLEPLENLTKLELLSISWNKNITNLKPLKNLINLKILTCSGTQIDNLEPLENLTKLELLSISWNKNITNLKPLKNLTKLEILKCSNTTINDLEPIGNLFNLKTLYCGGTNIESLEPLENLNNGLKILLCYKTKITNLKPLEKFTELEVLNISDNKNITSLKPLRYLTKLEKLFCKNISPSEISEFEKTYRKCKIYK